MNATKQRIVKATTALRPYRDADDLVSPVVDLLTDLRHYCDAHGVDFYEASDISYNHYLAERTATA